jgi:hypothetical protein
LIFASASVSLLKANQQEYCTMIKAVLIHLSRNMWSDRPPQFTDYLAFEEKTWQDILCRCSEIGINAIFLDVGDGIEFKVGKFGPYVTDGVKNISAKQYTADTITLEIARELLSNIVKKAEPVKIGENPETKKMIFFYPTGRYGAYISSNRVNVSVREQPDLETAIKLINNKAKKN